MFKICLISSLTCVLSLSASLFPNVCKEILTHKNLRLLPSINAKPTWGLNDDSCGRILPTPRIMGGRDARLMEFPWMVLIYLQADLAPPYHELNNLRVAFCGGSIISKKYILTAAHCVKNQATEDLKLVFVVGEYDFSKYIDCDDGEKFCAPVPVTYEMEEVFVHELAKATDNDIALVRVKGEIVFNEFVQPICLQTDCNPMQKHLVNRYATVAGWGHLESIPTVRETSVLQKVSLPIIDFTSCRQSYHVRDVHIDSRLHICAGGDERSRDVCTGDSGAPLMQVAYSEHGDPKWLQVGIVSGGDDCWHKRTILKPGIFTNVTSFLPWILDRMRD